MATPLHPHRCPQPHLDRAALPHRAWQIADRPVSGAFAVATRLRGSRAVHPDGVAHKAVLRVEPPPGPGRGVPLLDRPGEHRAIVRL